MCFELETLGGSELPTVVGHCLTVSFIKEKRRKGGSNIATMARNFRQEGNCLRAPGKKAPFSARARKKRKNQNSPEAKVWGEIMLYFPPYFKKMNNLIFLSTISAPKEGQTSLLYTKQTHFQLCREKKPLNVYLHSYYCAQRVLPRRMTSPAGNFFSQTCTRCV